MFMLTTNNPIIKHKIGLLNLAEELSNVSKACKIMDVSRETFYRYQELAYNCGVDALINRSKQVPNLKNKADETIEQANITYMQENFQLMVSTGVTNEENKASFFLIVALDQFG